MNSTFLWIGAAASDPGSASSMIAVMSGGTRVIDHTGVLDAPAVDFSRGYTNKHLDNIPDGSTYARPLSSRVSSGKPLIDFGEAIHLNKSLDNVPDGTRAAWASTTQKNAAVDANGNLLLKNISNGIGTTSGPTTSSTTYAVVPEMTQTITTKGNKVLLTFSTSLTLAEINDVGIFGFFRDGVQISQDYVIGTAAVGGSHAEIVALTYIDSPSAASHTFDVRWKVSNASELLTASGTARTFQVVELG